MKNSIKYSSCAFENKIQNKNSSKCLKIGKC